MEQQHKIFATFYFFDAVLVYDKSVGTDKCKIVAVKVWH